MTVRRNVLFKSSTFNTSDRREYFINDGCYGDDLAKWLIVGLKANGVCADDEPGQEDFGWYINFSVGAIPYCLVIAYRPEDAPNEGNWMCTIERVPGCLGFLTGAQNRGILADSAMAVHKVLAASPQISKVRWFDDQEYRSEKNGHSAPDGP